MTQYAKPAVAPVWGEGINTAADIVRPADTEIQAGWPSTQTPPSRQRFNWFFKYVSNGLRYFMQRGLPDWDTLESYDIGAKVTGPDGLSYRSKTANTSKVPATNAADWERWGLTADETTAIANTAAQAANPQLNLGTATLSGAAYTASAAPSAIPAGFSIRFLAAQPANPTLTVGTTTAPMVDSDGTPIAGIAANERRWVQWDGTSFVVAESDAGLSVDETAQVNTLISTALAGFSTTPAGSISYVAMSSAPSGWLPTNGAAISRTTYADLFAVIGTTHGVGNGTTTFNIPDLRGEFIRGFDAGRGVDAGRVFGTSQTDAYKSHSHPANSQPTPGDSRPTGGGVSEAATYGSSTGLSGGSETRPRNIALLACIKY